MKRERRVRERDVMFLGKRVFGIKDTETVEEGIVLTDKSCTKRYQTAIPISLVDEANALARVIVGEAKGYLPHGATAIDDTDSAEEKPGPSVNTAIERLQEKGVSVDAMVDYTINRERFRGSSPLTKQIEDGIRKATQLRYGLEVEE